MAEREAATTTLAAHWRHAPARHRTVGTDKAYDTVDFVDQARQLDVTPHVAQHDTRRSGSAIDARTTRHAGYAKSQQARPRIERACAWLKTIAGLRKVKLRNLTTVDALFVFASAAFNIKRIAGLRRRLHDLWSVVAFLPVDRIWVTSLGFIAGETTRIVSRFSAAPSPKP